MFAMIRNASATVGLAALLAAPGSFAEEAKAAVDSVAQTGPVPEVVVRAKKLDSELADLYAASEVRTISVEGVLGDLSSRLTAPELPQPVLNDL